MCDEVREEETDELGVAVTEVAPLVADASRTTNTSLMTTYFRLFL